MAVLGCLLTSAGEVVSQTRLRREVWLGRVVEDSAVPRSIALLRRALGDDARRPKYIETIPKRGYRTVAPVNPLPQGVAPDLAERRDPLILAVLPFDNLSADPDLGYLSDGISEEILLTVARTTGVKVIGRSSSFQFREQAKGASQVAAELACTHILDGSVRLHGERIRVSAQLIECAGQTTVWSDRFERELKDIFELQDNVAASVAGALQVVFSSTGPAGPIDPLAYDLYLRAKASSTQWLGACDAELLERALARAPTFSQAWATLAVTRAIESDVERDPALSSVPRARAREAANNALALDPNAGSAFAALSIIEPVCGRFAERDELIDKALQVAPNDPVALFWASRWSWAVGRIREGVEYAARACRVDPLWPQGLHQYASLLWIMGLEVEAGRIWDNLIARWPDRDYLHVVPLLVSAYTGNWARVDELEKSLATSGLKTSRTEFAAQEVARFRSWNPEATQKLADELTEEVERTGTLRFHLQWACHVGLTALVYALLERASFAHLFEAGGRPHERDFGLHALFQRQAEAFRGDIRFVRLCARLGLCDYWVTTGRWPDCADEVASRYDFRAEARRLVEAGEPPPRG